LGRPRGFCAIGLPPDAGEKAQAFVQMEQYHADKQMKNHFEKIVQAKSGA
jgi:hypothetical protein